MHYESSHIRPWLQSMTFTFGGKEEDAPIFRPDVFLWEQDGKDGANDAEDKNTEDILRWLLDTVATMVPGQNTRRTCSRRKQNESVK